MRRLSCHAGEFFSEKHFVDEAIEGPRMLEVRIVAVTSLCRKDANEVAFPRVFLKSLSQYLLILHAGEPLKYVSMLYNILVSALF